MNENGKNPILDRHVVSRTSVGRSRPVAGGNTTVVYVDREGRPSVKDRRLTAAEVWFDPPQMVYVVDNAIHTATDQSQLPTKEEAFSFDATITVTWQVRSPEEVVETRLTDARAVYLPYLLRRMRDITRRFDVESGAAAERAINTAFGERWVELPQGLALRSCTATLSLDANAIEHIAARTVAQRRQEIREREFDARLADGERFKKLAEVDHNLALLNQKSRQELEAEQQKHAIEMEKQRMDVYADVLKEGSLGLLKLRLARNPQDVDGVVKLIAEEWRLTVDTARAFLKEAMAKGVVQPSSVAPNVTKVADILTNLMSQPEGLVSTLSSAISADALIRHPAGDRPELADPRSTHGNRVDEEEDEDDDATSI